MKQKHFTLIISGTAAVCFIVLITFPEQSSKLTNISVSQLQEWAIYDAKPVSNRIKLNESERCEEPPLDPFDKSITSYVWRTAPLKCNRVYPDAVKFVERQQMLVLGKEFIDDSIYCTYKPIRRKEGITDKTIEYGVEVNFTQTITFSDQFAHVKCFNDSVEVNIKHNKIMFQFYRHTHVNPTINFPTFSNHKILTPTFDHPNVLFFGIDSTSNSNMKRQLNRTYKMLMEKGLIEMHRHNRVYDNSFTNMMAMMFGKYESWANEEFTGEFNRTAFFDEAGRSIFDEFKDKGYATSFFDDCAPWQTFNYFAGGWKNQPFHFYDKPYWKHISQDVKYDTSHTKHCYNAKPLHTYYLNLLRSFVTSRKNSRNFVFSWTTMLSHDHMNLPSAADDDFHDFLKFVIEKLPNTILLVVSDHGHRFGKFVNTKVGRAEGNLPFFAVHLPQAVKERCPGSVRYLKENARRRSTPFDIYSTLLSFAKSNFCVANSEEVYEELISETPRRNYSLLTSAIPLNRTCRQSFIMRNYCPPSKCGKSVTDDEPLTSELTVMAAEVVINATNELLSNYSSCVPLYLDKIISSSIQTNTDSGLIEQLNIIISASPGGAIFQAILEPEKNSQKLFHVFGSIDRNNAYGSTSHCVNDAMLKKLCLCDDVKL